MNCRAPLLTLLLLACGAGPRPAEARSPAPRAPRGACASSTPADVARLVARIDESPDPLHLDMTPAVEALGAKGLAGACAVIDDLSAKDDLTRLHAERVLELVVYAREGFRAGRGFADAYGEDEATAILGANAYRADDPPERRGAGAAKWRAWVEAQSEPQTRGRAGGPSLDAMAAALDRVRPELTRCGEPLDLRVTFGPTGAIDAVSSDRGPDKPFAACAAAATRSARIAPFRGEPVWLTYPR